MVSLSQSPLLLCLCTRSIGASGTGKSTALRIAAGLLAPDKGEVLIMGKPRKGLLSDQKEDTAQLSLGMVFQVGTSAAAEHIGQQQHAVPMTQDRGPALSLPTPLCSWQNAALFDSLTVGENVGFLLYEASRELCKSRA